MEEWGAFKHSDGTWHIGPSAYEYSAGQPTIADIGEHGSDEDKRQRATIIAEAPGVIMELQRAVAWIESEGVEPWPSWVIDAKRVLAVCKQ